MFNKIMIPSDGSKFAEKAEDVAIDLAKKLESTVVAVHIIDEKLIYPFDIMEEEGNKILSKIRAKGNVQDVKVDEVLIFGNPRHDMKKIAEKSHADMIVIGSHGRSGIEKILMGSVAENALKTVDVPVLLVK
ncbi:MAG: universal stress protein [Methanobacteriaceae archaeon]|jgi:nucleotide-binding universal stress UspA family protein|nr:universal stress protein [Methanobacteriaceae archaeon]MDP2837465.1 universal stress protein [Methanobacteriaceae archaeon]MDP3035634.1 universal stress protein [Methanobacteriaceae archaeon]MDP3485947.1 universal stress protein [Methanobacteriaceae archaeon]MDP3623562.1 universal stress protein [Methanobacteriaceae archaeon]